MRSFAGGAGAVVFLILASFVPVFLALFFIHKKKAGNGAAFALASIAAGIASVLLAAFLQTLFIPDEVTRSGSAAKAFVRIMMRVSLTEEAARAAGLAVLFAVFSAFRVKNVLFEGSAASAGLLAGVSFAALETSLYAASDSQIVFLRYLSAAPLHGSCGIRCAAAVFKFKEKPAASLALFLKAVLLHAFYNFMIVRGGVFVCAAVFISVTSLLSSLYFVRGKVENFEKNN